MGIRFPRHGGGRHEEAPGSGPAPAAQPVTPPGARETMAEIPSRACCCTARPVVKVMMPAAPARPAPVDLWLCGHHWRASKPALAKVGATVTEVGPPAAAAAGRRENAAV
jgi:hypothetical protein